MTDIKDQRIAWYEEGIDLIWELLKCGGNDQESHDVILSALKIMSKEGRHLVIFE